MALPPPDPGSTALITGASSGIGRELARELAQRGHGVVLVARRRERLEALAGELTDAHGVRAEALDADLQDHSARERLIERVEALGLRVEILVNNAGWGIYSPFPREGVQAELDQVELLVKAVIHLNAVYLPRMLERGRGAIMNVASTAGLQPLPGNGTYAAAKAFVLLHSEAMAAETKGTGITVTAVCPGPVRTEFQETSEPLFAGRLPRPLWASAERVARDSVRALERGKRMVIPGGIATKVFFAPNRTVPASLSLAVGRRLFSRELARGHSPGS